MSKRIYVGNLPYNLSDSELEQLFSEHGEVAEAVVVTDRFTGQPKGFGFVEMPNDTEASDAIAALNNRQIGGRAIVVNEARPREERPRTGGGGYGGGGGRGGRGGGDRRGGGGDGYDGSGSRW